MSWLFCAIACGLMVLSSVGPVAGEKPESPSEANGADLPDYVTGEVLVKFKDDTSADTVKKASKDVAAKELREFKGIGVKHWKLGDDISVDDAVKKIGKDYKDYIDYVEPNYILRATDIPSDSLRGDLWGMHNVGQTGGAKDADIDALEAWQSCTGSTDVVVAVIDSGIDYNHEDLAANTWKNPGETGFDGTGKDKATNGIDDDGNGYIDDVYGWNFYSNKNDPMDDNSHGTHCAGIIGAIGDNAKGVAGVCWDVKLMALKFLNSGGSGSTTAAISAINYAASFNVRITSNSWGGGSSSKALQSAIKNSGALFIAAAGNSGSSSVFYPAGYTLDNIISVAATDHNDALADFSNYGSSWVDLGAPGVDILSSTPLNTYGLKSGTSMACPHVSGAAALVMAKYTSKTNAEVKSQIMSTVDGKSSLSGKCVSGGRLNVRAAIGASELGADGTDPGSVSLTAGSHDGTSITYTWTATGDDGSDGTAYAYDLRYVEGSTFEDSAWGSALMAQREPAPSSSGTTTEAYTLTGLWPGKTYSARMMVWDEVGNNGAISAKVTDTTTDPGYAYATDSSIDSNTKVFYHSLAIDSSGRPGIGYGDSTNDDVKYAHWDGTSWTVVNVDTGTDVYTGVDIAYDTNGNPTFSYGWGKLKFAYKNGNSWSIDTVERSNANNDVTSLAYDGSGCPTIAYATAGSRAQNNGGLKFAKKSAGTWTTEMVSKGAYARYKDLVYHDGKPSIAYCDDLNVDGWYDAVMFASWDGTKWNIEQVETGGPLGTGTFLSLAYDGSGNPHIVSRRQVSGNSYSVCFYSKSGSTWSRQDILTENNPTGFSLAYNSAGTPYISFGTTGMIKVAYFDGTAWKLEEVDNCQTDWATSMVIYKDADNVDHLSFTYTKSDTDTLKYAVKTR